MNVLIFENEREYCESMFIAANILFYNKEIVYKWCNSSQEIGEFGSVKDYDIILVDLELSSQTQLDGYRILEELIKITDKRKVLILTGSSRVNEKLKEKNLPDFKVIKKPVRLDDIKSKFDYVLQRS